ncbi:hypothetical protein [Gilliamella apicola]|uniref:Uncharacterized protein n=1 Tax=Gilliamella apicola TaxID=1196095 RepID=A0A242NDX5_9GAMM|nr:hypothetical protein [Gilliamella apicola]OTP81841.1 hypothetical protein B5S44_14140 [Gilliamella apicola]OTP84022.1 hypothetical protein B5S40_01370 [Gilliamella apicola]OTP97914.1 hypothetical protein B6D08_12985 [Gilliamella apicola]OTQ09211.1 hypothetical protein B6D11_13635 [Gilliamella apicola]OTQ09363.1 hypothetical protein B6C91_09460 [Gilliamella apicola]
MAVCNFPQTSPPIGQASTSCLRKFTIHFRRPDKLKQNHNAPYKGEYGFDWLRDEYIYPIEMVYFDEVINSQNPVPINTYIELCKEHKKLKNAYLSDSCKPHGQDYYPAWLSIFACNVQGKNSNAGSQIHQAGVYLDLQLDEIDEIISDGTEIIFKPSKPCLKITPDKISISEFLLNSKKKRTLDSKNNQPQIYYYLLENAVKIVCQGDTLRQHEEIKVFAKLGSDEYEVGQLNVYKNDKICKANLFVINVITEHDYNNNKIMPPSPPSLKYILNNQSFNQALINVEIKVIEDFDLYALKVKTQDQDIINLLNYIAQPYANLDPGLILNELNKLYDRYGKNRPKDPTKPNQFLGINDHGHKNTYLLLTGIKIRNGDSRGYSTISNYAFKHSCVIYHHFTNDDITIPHEIAHTFSLPHTFERFAGPEFYPFHKGYTDNYMDYPNYLDKAKHDAANKYQNKTYSFCKWQWDEMRKDESLENNEKK